MSEVKKILLNAGISGSLANGCALKIRGVIDGELSAKKEDLQLAKMHLMDLVDRCRNEVPDIEDCSDVQMAIEFLKHNANENQGNLSIKCPYTVPVSSVSSSCQGK